MCRNPSTSTIGFSGKFENSQRAPGGTPCCEGAEFMLSPRRCFHRRCLRLMLMASSSCHGGLSTFVGCPGLVVPTPPPPTFGDGSFRPASLSRSTSSHRCRGSLTIAGTRRSRGGRVLCGYFGVNDYFASFDNKNKNADAHKGGLFDVNTYLSSLSKNAVVDDDDSAGDGGSTSVWSSQMQQQEQQHQPPPPTPLTARREMTYEEIVAYNNARLCPKLLLTQCAMQSFVYLLEECRDPHSVKWIEDFLGTKNLGDYHGTGAINVARHRTWDSVLYDMMNQPNTRMIVSAKRRGRGHGGWSKHNPHLVERYAEFRVDIRPASLVQRLLAVRGQLASEFEKDLGLVRMIDVTVVMSMYYRKLAAAVANDDDAATTKGEGMPQSSLFDRVSLDIITSYMKFQDDGIGDGSLPSSPLRRANFDLLYGLCTRASAHRLLWELERSASSSSTNIDDIDDNVILFEWFKQFYVDNAPLYFDGDQNFGRSDEFIDAVLRAPPPLPDGWHSTDPLRMAQRIVSIQKDVALEWMGMMEEVEEDHRVLNDVIFRVMMGRTMEESGNAYDVAEIREETTFEGLTDGTGTFE